MTTAVLLAILAAAPSPSWPKDLTTGWTAITVRRTVPNEPERLAKLELGADGVWRMTAPFRGDADVDAIARLKVALEAPQLAGAKLPPTPESFAIELRQGKNVRRVATHLAGLNQPIAVTVDGASFVISPVEFATKLPDPGDFAPPGLWVAARNDAISIEVKGRSNYKLIGRGEDWKVADGGVPNHDLDDVVGVIVGRQASGHPSATLKLDPPAALATLCTAKECRDFKFATANGRYYALAPGADWLELRDNDWKLLVEGPLKRP